MTNRIEEKVTFQKGEDQERKKEKEYDRRSIWGVYEGRKMRESIRDTNEYFKIGRKANCNM